MEASTRHPRCGPAVDAQTTVRFGVRFGEPYREVPEKELHIPQHVVSHRLRQHHHYGQPDAELRVCGVRGVGGVGDVEAGESM